jgi:hypothetical protein
MDVDMLALNLAFRGSAMLYYAMQCTSYSVRLGHRHDDTALFEMHIYSILNT